MEEKEKKGKFTKIEEESISVEFTPEKPVVLLTLVDRFKRPDDVIAVNINSVTKNLNTNIRRVGTVKVTPVYRDSMKGEAILRRSMVFVMGKAMDDVLKEKKMERREFMVRHQVVRGYFCEFGDRKAASEQFIKDVKEKMKELCSKKADIRVSSLYHSDAMNYFKKAKQDYTVRLLESQNWYDVRVDTCGDYMDLHHRVLAPNTRFCSEFDIIPREHGWVLKFLFKTTHQVYREHPQLEDTRVIKIMREQTDFNHQSSNVKCVGDINSLVYEEKVEDFIRLCDTFHERMMNTVAKRIKERGTVRLILIAGPSASGKTTFAKKLSIILHCTSLSTKKKAKIHMISVDNYFRPNVECPIIPETGDYDFECLEALRINLLNDHLKKLFRGEKVMMPKFDFHRGEPIDNQYPMQIGESDILIMEGIHCLNEKLTEQIEKELKFKIFIAPFSPINLDNRNYISNATFRLMRRLVRDWLRRGHSVEGTLFMWPNVRKSEHKYIFPYMNSSDFIFNTAFDYEIGVLKRYVKPLLKAVKPDSKFFEQATELLSFLEKFAGVPYKFVRRDSILNEFIGGHWFN